MRLLFLGDVVGEPGRKALYQTVPRLISELQLDAVIVNGENAAGGQGITPALAQEFFAFGVNAITLGDHAWDQATLIPWLQQEPRVIRPFNYPPDTPGRGSALLETPAGLLGILCLQGRTFMRVGVENPFPLAQKEVARLRTAGACAVLVDVHAETTSEKTALGYHLDGHASVVIGTHTHVQTNDARILPHGTAYMTDAGMCGPRDGIIGRRKDDVLASFLTCLPHRFPVAKGPAILSGACVDIDAASGLATSITPFNQLVTV